MRQFVRHHIESVQQVEILGLISGDPERDWSIAEVSRSLQIVPAACARWVDGFTEAGALTRSRDGVRFAACGDHATAVVDLVQLYGRRRIAVTEAIHGAR